MSERPTNPWKANWGIAEVPLNPSQFKRWQELSAYAKATDDLGYQAGVWRGKEWRKAVTAEEIGAADSEGEVEGETVLGVVRAVVAGELTTVCFVL